MGLHYCSDQDLLDYLPANLDGSPISTAAERTAKLRTPSKEWVDSVYPHESPFPAVCEAIDWQVNQTNHAAGDTTVTIDGGTTDPAAGDVVRAMGSWQYHDTALNFAGKLGTDDQLYMVTAYAANVVTYSPAALADWGDNAPLMFGTPRLVRRACAFFGMYLALQILRENPLDELATAYRAQAFGLLGVSKFGDLATVRPETTSRKQRTTSRIVRA